MKYAKRRYYKMKLEFRRICRQKKFKERQVILEQEKIKSDNVHGIVVINHSIKFPTNNRNLKSH